MHATRESVLAPNRKKKGEDQSGCLGAWYDRCPKIDHIMSSSTDSENESAPELNVEVSGKKRSLSVSGRPTQRHDSGSKRSRMSRIRGGVEELLASLNKDDDIQEDLTNKENQDGATVSAFETPHSRRSNSLPGSRVVDKTLVRKSASVTKNLATTTKKGAPSKSTASKEARKASSTLVDITPNRLTSADTLGNLDVYDSGSNLDNSFESRKSRSRSRSPTHQNVSVALKEITSLLNTVVKRMDRMESELKRHSTSISSSSSGECTKKSKVPLVVKSEVRKTYNMLIEDEENDFEGFDLDPSVPFNAPTNEATVGKLVKEVIANNPQFQACDIRAAARTYYKTKSQEKSLKERGKYEERGKVRRRRERLLRKLQERSSILQKSDMPPKTKEKWSKVLLAEVMSSEESGPEEDDMFVKPLPWRSDLVNKFFGELDERSTERKTPQALRQRKKRIVSVNVSTRGAPPGLPKWALSV